MQCSAVQCDVLCVCVWGCRVSAVAARRVFTAAALLSSAMACYGMVGCAVLCCALLVVDTATGGCGRVLLCVLLRSCGAGAGAGVRAVG